MNSNKICIFSTQKLEKNVMTFVSSSFAATKNMRYFKSRDLSCVFINKKLFFYSYFGTVKSLTLGKTFANKVIYMLILFVTNYNKIMSCFVHSCLFYLKSKIMICTIMIIILHKYDYELSKTEMEQQLL